MEDDLWQRVDGYLEDRFIGEDEALQAALQASSDAGLPSIQVSPLQGKFLHVLARLLGARRVLEIGSLGGYSAIWLGRALPPGGSMVSLEVNPKHAEIARANLERAGLSGTVEVRVGPALETLPRLAGEVGEATFDLAFIDADKPNNPGYFAWAKRLVRPGGAVVVDNVVRQGRIAEDGNGDADVIGTRRLFDAMATGPGVSASALQTVGAKGYDGFALAIVEP
jgi:predicted O-methyltransferase YrrM